MIMGLLGLVTIGGAVVGVNQVQLQTPMREVIEQESRNEGIEFSVHFGRYIQLDTLVLEVESVRGGKSIADVTRVLFSFAEKVADQDFERIEFSHAGTVKFVMQGSDFKTIGREYGEQNPVYMMRTLPEKLRKPDGTPAFGRWEGGLLGVLQKQMEEYRMFHEQWYLKDLGLG